MSGLYKKCPKCGSNNVINIIYGMPSYELFLESEKGKVRLGGCEIIEGCSEYACKDCNHEWNKQQILDHAYGKITRVRAFVGGFRGSNYEVDMDFRNLRLAWNGDEDESKSQITKVLDEQDCKNIAEHLKMLNLLGWKTKYEQPEVCDGTQWSVQIETGDKTIHKYGSNKYPKEWKLFCKFVTAIVGQNFG